MTNPAERAPALAPLQDDLEEALERSQPHQCGHMGSAISPAPPAPPPPGSLLLLAPLLPACEYGHISPQHTICVFQPRMCEGRKLLRESDTEMLGG